MAASIYILKVIICSGILYGYYHLFLRNRVFHDWNRFYLLAIIPLSTLLPVLEITLSAHPLEGNRIVYALQVVAGADEFVSETGSEENAMLSGELIVIALYILVAVVITAAFMRAMIRLRHIIRKHHPVKLEDFYFLDTTEPGTPFSFFRYLFWNQQIPLESENGQRILEHELVHIRERHSWDKAFIHLAAVVFWINPVFWLIRREMAMVHEFIADSKAVGQGDADAFARLILEASFPGQATLLTQSFFQSSIKRRIAMFTRKNNTRAKYISRLMMIPVLLVLALTFAVKAEQVITDDPPHVTSLGRKYTVVLDAGHGGNDAGAIAGGVKEKDLNLALAKAVKAMNKNPDLDLVMTRSSDQTLPLQGRVNLAAVEKADLFISLHLSADPDASQGGITAYISNRDHAKRPQNIRLATLLLGNLGSVRESDKNIRQRDQSVFVLDRNSCPAVILECGYISNAQDRNFMLSAANQEKLAAQILRSIEEYFSGSVEIRTAQAADSIPTANNVSKPRYFVNGDEVKPDIANSIDPAKIASVDVRKTETGDIVRITLKEAPVTKVRPAPLYILDGKAISEKEWRLIDPEKIETVNILKDKPAEEAYGTKGKNGVVEIRLKKGS